MAKKPERRGLGRGLSALIAETSETAQQKATNSVDVVAIEKLKANPDQPRRAFDDAELDSLAASIMQSGIIQPLIVRPDPTKQGTFQIVAGERRWRAAQRAQFHDVPVVVRDFNDQEVLEVGIIENVQRVDLNPIDEAQGYRQLMDRFGHTQEAVATALGKSRSHIANLLRLLTLPEPVAALVKSGKLSAGHARALITSPDPMALAQVVIAKGLSVRQTEELAKQPEPRPQKKMLKPEKDADTRAIEADLTAALKMRVHIDHAPGAEGGQLKITYRSLDDLDRLLEVLSGP